jgi:hypothetical protein
MCTKQTTATNNQTACGSEAHNSINLETQVMEEAATITAQFLGTAQKIALAEACEGEEGAHFAKLLLDLGHLLETMPKNYEQDGKGDDAIAYLHYFLGGMDWFITERDMEDEQLQAFGYADLGMGCAELGYINIQEITALRAELDLYWTPKTLAEIKKGRG